MIFVCDDVNIFIFENETVHILYALRMSETFGAGPEIERDPRRFVAQPSTILHVASLFFSFIIFCCIVSIVDVNNQCIFHSVSTCGFVKFVSSLAWINCMYFFSTQHTYY